MCYWLALDGKYLAAMAIASRGKQRPSLHPWLKSFVVGIRAVVVYPAKEKDHELAGAEQFEEITDICWLSHRKHVW